jgi:DNA-binding transcriptional ArsR family regulator
LTSVELLGHGQRSVVEIAGAVPISRPAVSQHLKVLKDAGLVTVQPLGTRRIYGIDPRGLAAVRDYFDQFWSGALAACSAAVESAASQPRASEEQA